ncbi:NAD(P)/FAD-dependent oxidoreductase [Lentibacter sp. XHP0401]|uniref:NAD(P)/FAD-dependent oxidoreductase n=1 Tax=Lentibacter sp. XHP0401 TaxID=2984334 RepID=UPI0021E74B0B|nr:FAD-binding oxidoreductase [Lentibacter sp. XHP0401]MCV2893976.1 FAD-binding oxidoreductase [Lentibacter sp. XHP0401]
MNILHGVPLGMSHAPEHESALPAEADAVIIGGGIIGICTAYYLAKQGLKPLVLEKGRVAAEQSARNWGWIRKTGRDYAELPIVIEAQERWEELAAVCRDDFGLRRAGVTFLPKDEAQLEKYEAWARDFGEASGTVMLGHAQVAAMLPDAVNPWGGAMHTASDMVAEPFEAVPAIARAAVAAGAVIREGCAVRGLERAGGAVSGVVTEAGAVKTKLVLVAAGAWSSLFLRREGVSIPQLSVRSNVLATAPMPLFFDGAAGEDAMSFRRRKDGGYTMASLGVNHLWVGPDAVRNLPHYRQLIWGGDFGMSYRLPAAKDWPDGLRTKRRWALDEETPFERMRVLDPRPSDAALDRMLDKFAARFPKVGRPKVARRWAGMIDTMPDVVPVVDHASIEGLSICTGMCGHGFGIGPAFGRIMADMMTGHTPGHDLSRFRLARFDSYARLELGPDV